jgi:hypothetical protein
MRQRFFSAAAALAIFALFLAFAGDGIRAYFTPDDMMNLYGAWFRPLLEADRPLGALVYRGLFGAFGLNPLPYRIVSFILLFANLGLLYLFCRRLSGSREVAALAVLLGAYHAHLADLYYSTGTIYDLLCFSLYFSAFLWYLTIRDRGRSPGWLQIAAITALYLAAFAAKEMAVTLPLFIFLYEIVYHAPKAGIDSVRAFVMRLCRILGPLGLTTAALVVRKISGPGRMTGNPAYRPDLSWNALMGGWRHYLTDLFYGSIEFTNTKVVLLWCLLLIVAFLVRRRAMWFAWCTMFFGLLPINFITPRGFFVTYLALPGWYLYTAVLLVALRDALVRPGATPLPGIEASPRQIALFCLCLALLIPLHQRRKPFGSNWVAEAHQWVRAVNEPLSRRFPTFPHAAKVLFLSDPYPVDDWILTFIFRLHYRDDEIRVDRVKITPALASSSGGYDFRFRMDRWQLQSE